MCKLSTNAIDLCDYAHMDWSNLELKVYAADVTKATCKLHLPNDSKLYELTVIKKGNSFELMNNPVSDKTNFKIKNF